MCAWPVTPQNFAPVTCALTVGYYQIPNLRQYLKAPAANVDACRNPKLRAGRFVNIPLEQVPQAQALLAKMELQFSDSLRFGQALMQFQKTLHAEAVAGMPLSVFYPRLPHELRGYVELVYDYSARPDVRVIEPLMYESGYYKKHLQSVRIFDLKRDQDRDFIFSTPRLPRPGEVHWEVAFDDARLDYLFRLDAAPRPLEEIRERLAMPAAQFEVLRALMEAKAPPRAPDPWIGEGARVRHLGHACMLVEHAGAAVLIDPYISAHPAEGDRGRPSFDALPAHIDYVLITHAHHDHFSLETLLRLRHRIGCLVVPRSYGLHYGDVSLKMLARRAGFTNVVEMDVMERLALPDGEIVAVPFLGEHSDLPHAKTAYVVAAGSQRMLFAADSDCLDPQLYQHVAAILGPVQSVFLGMECVGAPLTWNTGALLPVAPSMQQDQARRQHGANAERGMKLLRELKGQRLYLYAMGLEPWFEWLLGLAYTDDAVQIQEAKQILKMARDEGALDARLLRPGSTIVLETAGAPGTHSGAGAPAA